ncbi:hypothetical protein ACFT8P_33840 [Streptomyces sp. NPDC057101]|uniref:hypothetical protein n=1 Tax=Streptomyces sp. NPDC057101 TaxID=3346020 RepID=UPI0036334C6A
MTSFSAQPLAVGLYLEPAATDHARRRVDDLMADFRTGNWSPSPLEARIAELLLVSTADDGMLTHPRVCAALQEGSIAMTSENGGRFAQVLADLRPVLHDPRIVALDIIDAAGELVGAVASTTHTNPLSRNPSA